MLHRGNSYDEVYRSFRWEVPERFNIGVAACDRHATGEGRLALIYEAPDGTVERFSFDDLKRLSNRCANALAGLGIRPGDRVGILLPQRPETAIAHLAVYKLGAVAVPLFIQFGPDALEHRLADSGARALITDGENLPKVPGGLPELATILVVDGDSNSQGGGHPLFWPTLERASDHFAPADTAKDDPALIIYTSGTTGKPKGALHAHRVLLGHLPGVQLPHDFFPQPGDLYWTPADWAWIGGLLDVLLPSLYFGVPVLAHRARKFDPEEAFALIGRHGVRNAFLPPTALKMMRPVARRASASASICARWRAAARRSARTSWPGRARRSASRSTSSTARPRPTCWSAIAPRSFRCARARWDGRSPGTVSRWSRPKASRWRRARPASSRCAGPTR